MTQFLVSGKSILGFLPRRLEPPRWLYLLALRRCSDQRSLAVYIGFFALVSSLAKFSDHLLLGLSLQGWLHLHPSFYFRPLPVAPRSGCAGYTAVHAVTYGEVL